MTSEALNLRVEGDRARTVLNALEAAAEDMGATLRQKRGRAKDGEVTRTEALEEVAESYTGWSP